MPKNNRLKTVAIVGGGFSGTLTAIQLLRHSPIPLRILLIEKEPEQRAGGVAYSNRTAKKEHLTNLSIDRMSAFEDRPNDLLDWIQQSDRFEWPDEYRYNRYTPLDPIPRRLYQRYLQERYDEAVAKSVCPPPEKIDAELTDISLKRKGKIKIDVLDSNGDYEVVDHLILATGYSGAKKAGFTKDIEENSNYIPDPHSKRGHNKLKKIDKNEDVFLIGSSQSAYDVVTSLLKQKHKGKIYLCSRNGYLHSTYQENGLEPPLTISTPKFMKAKNLPALITGIRKDFWSKTQYEGHSPERVLEAYEKFVPELIKKFPQDTIRNLLNTHASLLGTLRIGINPETANLLEDAKIRGQVVTIAANIHKMKESKKDHIKIRYTPAGSEDDKTLEVGHVISCLGREVAKDRLWKNLEGKGLAVPHFTGMGIEVGKHGELVDTEGKKSRNITVVGALTGGATLERHGVLGAYSISVPTIRKRVERTALNVLDELLGKRKDGSWVDRIRGYSSYGARHRANSCPYY